MEVIRTETSSSSVRLLWHTFRGEAPTLTLKWWTSLKKLAKDKTLQLISAQRQLKWKKSFMTLTPGFGVAVAAVDAGAGDATIGRFNLEGDIMSALP